MPETDILVNLKAIDNASRTIQEASDKIKGSLSDVENSSKRVADQQKEVEKSSKGLITGFSGAATSAFSLYNAYDRVADMQVSVDKANLQVKTSTNSVEDAQRRVTSSTVTLENAQKEAASAMVTGGSNSEAYAKAMVKVDVASGNLKAAQDDATLAQERLSVATDRAQMVQENMSQAMVQSALQVIPTTITMVDSLSRAWKNFPDMTKTLSNIGSKIGDVGISAKTAAISVGAFVGGFLIADALFGAIPEDLRAIAGALTATIVAIVAAAIAWMAFHGTMTVGVAVPIILAAVGVGIAGVKAAVGMATGGVITEPTLAVIGEAGPEVVIPLSRFSEVIEKSVSETVKTTSLIGRISHFAEGGIIREPTLIMAGEAGPEVYTPLSRYESMISEMSETQHFEISPVIHIGNITGVLSPSQVITAVSEGTAKGVSQGIAEAVRRRRG